MPDKPLSNAIGFTDLPGEIRNRIYDYVFEERAVLIVRGKRSNNDSRYLYNILVCKPFSPYQGALRINKDHIELGFLFSCKLVYNEALPIMYGKVAFAFNTAKTITRFLSRVPNNAIAAITYIGIHQQAYGEPSLMNDVVWKIKSDDTWNRLYRSIGQRMTSLRYIALCIQIRTWPVSLDPNELWAVAVRQLGSNRFIDASISVYSPMFHQRELTAVSENLANSMRRRAELQPNVQNLELSHPAEESRYGHLFYTLRSLLGHASSGVENFPNMPSEAPKPYPKATKILRIRIAPPSVAKTD